MTRARAMRFRPDGRHMSGHTRPEIGRCSLAVIVVFAGLAVTR
ncbi:hypothetical protein [Nonomuraea sp. NPDC048916]